MKKILFLLLFCGVTYLQESYSQQVFLIPPFDSADIGAVSISSTNIRANSIDSSKIPPLSISDTDLRANIPATKLNVPNTALNYITGFGTYATIRAESLNVNNTALNYVNGFGKFVTIRAESLNVNNTALNYINGFGKFVTIRAESLNVNNTVKYYLNGFGKFVAGNTDSIIEGATNLFYTDARAKAIIVDTVMKAFGFYLPTAADSGVVYEVRESAESIVEIRALVTGGTSGTLNATRTRSGTLVNLLTANGTVNAGTAFASAGTVQNGTLLVGDIIRATLRGVSGSPTEIVLQITISKPH